MKILSMNVHSLIETEEGAKLEQFARMVQTEQPDVIGLQEVSQTGSAPVVADGEGLVVMNGPESSESLKITVEEGWEGYVPCRGRAGEDHSPVLLRQDNYALRLAARLRQLGTPYYWTWIPIKLGYGKYDEGLAIFSKTPVSDTDRFFISRSRDYGYWKTREILGVRTQAGGHEPFWVYTVHMGWWDDEEEPFNAQWEQVEKGLEAKLAKERAGLSAEGAADQTGDASGAEDPGLGAGASRAAGLSGTGADGPLVWLMGDFNSPAQVRGEGYDLIAGWGWQDTYQLAQEKDSGITVEGVIDGWREKLAVDGSGQGGPGEDTVPGMRIDHIWCSKEVGIKRSQVLCDGRHYPKVSDHNGVMVTL